MLTITQIKKQFKTKVVFSIDSNPVSGRRVYPFKDVSLSHEYDFIVFMNTNTVELERFRAVGCTYYGKNCGLEVCSARIPGGLAIYRKGVI